MFTDRQIARVCHNANKAYCEESGDMSQVEFELAPEWQQSSAILGVAAVRADPAMTAADQHQCWLDFKVADGWVYGEAKDAEAKTHPCCVPYDQLPPQQKAKDSIFGAIARAMLAVEN